MKKEEKGLLRNNKGFTLIELIMVIVILGILAAVAIPKYFDMKSEASDATARGITAGLRGAVSVLYAENILGGATGSAYNMTDIVDSAQISGVEGPTSGTNTFRATIGDSDYNWTLNPMPNLPTEAGKIVAKDPAW